MTEDRVPACLPGIKGVGPDLNVLDITFPSKFVAPCLQILKLKFYSLLTSIMFNKSLWLRVWPGLAAVGLNSTRIPTSSRLLSRATFTTTSSLIGLNLSTEAGTTPRPLIRNISQYNIWPCLGGWAPLSNGRCYSVGRTRDDSLAERENSQFRSQPSLKRGEKAS